MTRFNLKSIAWMALSVIIFITLSPIGLRPSDHLPVNLDRMLAFCIMFFLFGTAYPKRWKWIAGAAIVGPGILELLQLFSPSRHAHFEDASIKAIGALIGVAVSLWSTKLLGRVQTRRLSTKKKQALRRFNAKQGIREMPVNSRMIKAIYFDQTDGQLRIRLNNGGDRLFEGVTEIDAVALTSATSPGTHYLNHFRTRHKRAA